MSTFMEHLKLTFVAEKPPPSHISTEVALIAAEEKGFSGFFMGGPYQGCSGKRCCRGISCPDMIFRRRLLRFFVFMILTVCIPCVIETVEEI